ncbi:hypothetical protein [Chelativorans sp. M5D2P16]|uniref:hypothetical protein n=1 Tax=Chelativorans sp. M5D2P16 TaxID=3095678 RepID=UPI002ACA4928|nr:hypothetical protein [Chelativorans sp. M5D2P16]MDZ5700085.1 hypothetical protein [Chelativorans sp. M5D2P16]
MNGLTSTTDDDKNPQRENNHSGKAKAPSSGTGDYRLEALGKLLASEHFRASERNKRFLKFVVEETVAGRAARIKAFTVAVDVFGRDSNFDASVDPIVRIAAGHLRRALDEYYATHGRDDPVRIALPLGTYVPTFTIRESLPRRAVRRLQLLAADRRRRLQSGAVGAVMALSAAAAALVYVSLPPQASAPQKPVVVVDHARAQGTDAGTGGLADLFTQSLWIALSRQEAVRMVGVRPEEEFGTVLAHARARFGVNAPVLQLLTTVAADESELRVYWHVLDGRSNETYLSASAAMELAPGQRQAVHAEVARQVAASLARLEAGTKAGQAVGEGASASSSRSRRIMVLSISGLAGTVLSTHGITDNRLSRVPMHLQGAQDPTCDTRGVAGGALG